MRNVRRYASENDPENDDEYDEEFDPWVFIHDLPPLASCVPAKRAPILPKKTCGEPKNTLVRLCILPQPTNPQPLG
jgi:hypothetical protein